LVTGIITERGVFSPADLVGMRLSKASMGASS
jgi:methylthioribose-1-phosphate isomerase